MATPVVVIGLWVGGVGAAAQRGVPEREAAGGRTHDVPVIDGVYAQQLAFMYWGAEYDAVTKRLARREGEFAHLPVRLSTREAIEAIDLWHKSCEAQPTPINIKARALLADGLQPHDHDTFRLLRSKLKAERVAAAQEAMRIASVEADRDALPNVD